MTGGLSQLFSSFIVTLRCCTKLVFHVLSIQTFLLMKDLIQVQQKDQQLLDQQKQDLAKYIEVYIIAAFI